MPYPICEPVQSTDDLARAQCAEVLRALSASGIPFLVGGTYALRHYTQSARPTKDLDVFVRAGDVHRVLDLFGRRGCRVELPYPHWLGKIFLGGFLTDVIFSSGNGIATVDDIWFAHAVGVEVCGVPVRLSPPEEMIWSKAFVQERKRFDGADVLHLIHHVGARLDWIRLLRRFGRHWRVLLAHLVLFDFAYPDRRDQVPDWVIVELSARLITERGDSSEHVCYGTLLSRQQYLDDVYIDGYQDGRVEPVGQMTHGEIAIWTAAIKDDE